MAKETYEAKEFISYLDRITPGLTIDDILSKPHGHTTAAQYRATVLDGVLERKTPKVIYKNHPDHYKLCLKYMSGDLGFREEYWKILGGLALQNAAELVLQEDLDAVKVIPGKFGPTVDFGMLQLAQAKIKSTQWLLERLHHQKFNRSTKIVDNSATKRIGVYVPRKDRVAANKEGIPAIDAEIIEVVKP